MFRKTIGILAVNLILMLTLVSCGGADHASDGSVQSNAGAQADAGDSLLSGGDENAPSHSGEGTKQTKTAVSAELQKLTDVQLVSRFITAVKELDSEALMELSPEGSDDIDEDVIGFIEAVKQDPEDLEFWNNTIGSVVYLEASDALLVKSTDYVLSKWYTDCWKNNEELPAESYGDFPIEYLEEIYRNYYADAPYIICPNISRYIIYKDEEGNRGCQISELFGTCGMICSHLFGSHRRTFGLQRGDYRATILFDDGDGCLGLGYDYILDQTPDYEILMSKDLEAMTEITRASMEERKPGNIYGDAFRNYYEVKEYRDVLQKCFNDDCEVYRAMGHLCFFINYDIDRLSFDRYCGDTLTQEDKELIKKWGIRIVSKDRVRDYPDDWDFYYDFYEYVKNQGLLGE